MSARSSATHVVPDSAKSSETRIFEPDHGSGLENSDVERRADVEKSAKVVPPAAPAVDEAEENFKPKTLKFILTMLSIFLGLFLVALDRTIVGTASPQISSEFHSPGDIGWYGSAYQLTTSASQLVFGRVYKFYNTKTTFLACVALFEVGSLICGAAPSSVAFIIGRSIAGLGGAGIFSGVMVIMLPLVPLRKRPMFQGLFGMTFGVASAAGPLIGGAFTTYVTWRWCFYINLPIGAFAAVCLILMLKVPKKEVQRASAWEQFVRLDPLGTFFFVPSIVCLLLALQWGGSTYAWGNWRIILLLLLFAVLLLCFMAVQVLMPNTATVPVRIISQRTIAASALFMFAVAGSMLMLIYFLPLWFQVVQGVSAVTSGIYTLPFVGSLVVGSITSGIFTQKIGYYVPSMLLSPSIMAVGEGLMSTFKVGASSGHWAGYQVLTGIGLGFGMQQSTLAAQAVLPKPDIPTGVSIMFFMQQLGGAIFTSVGQNLLSSSLLKQLSDIPGVDASDVASDGATDVVSQVPAADRPQVLEAYNTALTRIFLAAMGVALVAVVAAWFVEWKNIRTTGPNATPPPPPVPTATTTGTLGAASDEKPRDKDAAAGDADADAASEPSVRPPTAREPVAEQQQEKSTPSPDGDSLHQPGSEPLEEVNLDEAQPTAEVNGKK